MTLSNKQENIVTSWFVWHFYEMLKFLFSVWKNYFSFVLNYFSVPLLLMTLFSPWRKYRDNYPKSFDIGEYFSTFVYNVFSRAIGMILRFVLIIFGVIAQIFVIALGIIIILFWIAMPFVLIALIFTLVK